MNSQLKKLYESQWENYIDQVYIPLLGTAHEPAYPYLMKVSSEYENAKKRVMFCGRETYGWGGEFPLLEDASVDGLMNVYDNIVNENWIFSGFYWNFVNKIREEHPDIGFIVENIVKVGKKSSKGCDKEICDCSKDLFRVKDEIRITRPDLIIFLTGPNEKYNYDGAIKEQLGDVELKPISGGENQDALVFADASLPNAYRFNHPTILRTSGTEKYTKNLINQIISNL